MRGAPPSGPSPDGASRADPAGSPRDLDFWLGTWRGTWDGGRGVNRITRLYEPVVLERFEGTGPDLLGTSVSVFDLVSGRWRQTWVDSEGSLIDLAGGPEPGSAMTLLHDGRSEGRPARFRMRFLDVTPEAFRWEWARSWDGEEWELRWGIDYERLL